MVGVEDETPLDYVSNAYLLLDLKLISQIYAALGDTSTSQRYAKIRDEVYTAFQRRFYDAKTHFYANGSQTAQALALELGLVPDSKRQLVFAELAKDVEQLGRLDVGIIGARVLLRALSDGGRSDLAFLVATQTEKPGWGFWMKSGATTLWEGWNRGASLNHIMHGDVSAWFYAWIAGIQQEPDSIAFERILFRPNPVGGLREASGSYLSARGRVS